MKLKKIFAITLMAGLAMTSLVGSNAAKEDSGNNAEAARKWLSEPIQDFLHLSTKIKRQDGRF